MTAPDAAAVAHLWTARIVLGLASVVLGLFLATGTAHAESPLGLDKVDKTVGKVADTVRAANSSGHSPSAKKVLRKASKPAASQVSTRVSKTVKKSTQPLRSVTHRSTVRTTVAKPLRTVSKKIVPKKVGSTSVATKKIPTTKITTVTRAVKRTVSKPATSRPETKPARTTAKAVPAKAVPAKAVPAKAVSKRPTHSATKPATKTTVRSTISPAVSSTIALSTTSLHQVARTVTVADDAVRQTAVPPLQTIADTLPEPLEAVVTDEVLDPVVDLHDTVIASVDNTLTATLPAVIMTATKPVGSIVDVVHATLPPTSLPTTPLPSTPLPPIHPDPSSAPVAPAPVLNTDVPNPAVPNPHGASGSTGSSTSAQPASTTSAVTPAPLLAPWTATYSATAVAAETSARATAGVLLTAQSHSVFAGPLGGDSGSAAPGTAGLMLLAFAAAASLWAVSTRSPFALGPIIASPVRRSIRPSFSPD